MSGGRIECGVLVECGVWCGAFGVGCGVWEWVQEGGCGVWCDVGCGVMYGMWSVGSGAGWRVEGVEYILCGQCGMRRACESHIVLHAIN